MDAPDPTVAALVARLGDALGAATRPSELQQELQAAVARIRELYGAAACSFAQVEPDGATLRFVAADGVGADTIVGVRLPVSRGIVGWVAVSGEPMHIADVSRDQRFARDVAESTDYVPDSILAAPVVDEYGDTAGVIEVLDATVRGENTGRDLAVLGLVADQLASVIRLSSRYDALGTGLLRLLVDPERTGAFDEAMTALAEEDTGAGLGDVAEAFRRLAASGPAAARLAGTILQEVAAYVSERR